MLATTACGPTRSCAREGTRSRRDSRRSGEIVWDSSVSGCRRVTERGFMNFGLTETQQTQKNTVRKFLAAECPMADVRKLMETDTAFDPALWRKIAEQGWTGIIFPEEYGGFGMGMVEMAVTLEEMGRALLPGPYFSTGLAARTLLGVAGNDNHKQKYLAPICSGEVKATVALLEESAAWDPGAVMLSAAGCSLCGRKLFVPDAAVADFLICAARLDGDLALFVVPARSHGMGIKPNPTMSNTP